MGANNSTLIIGLPKSGKTTFLAQLYVRIETKKCRIALSRTPENIKSILNACRRLANGEEPEPTPASDNVELRIPVTLGEKSFDLVCPDYGGEQVSNITEFMEYDKGWGELTKNNDRWILFIRPGQLYHHYDLSLKGYAEIDDVKDGEQLEHALSDQYRFIELLQSLLYARGVGVKTRLSKPKLLIVLTCWDELSTEEKPNKVLENKLPLFHHFVQSVWSDDSLMTIGLSAQEFPLDNKEAQDKYLDELPESFGYLKIDDEEPDKDLTKLIEIALNL
jgi:hypothetical protein